MEFRYRRPSPRLAGFVEILWYWEGPRRPHDFERLLPDGSMELIVNLREDEVRAYDRRDLRRFERLEGCILTGPRSEYFVIDTDQQTRVLGVHFRPVWRLHGDNGYVDVDALDGREVDVQLVGSRHGAMMLE